MRYTILTLGNPEREPYKAGIREQMGGVEEVEVECVRGTDEKQLNANIDRHGFDINFPEWRPGEGGVWYSNINAWKYAAESGTGLMVFEDDAILHPNFREVLDHTPKPTKWDFITYYIPYVQPNQVLPITHYVPVDQEHGNVCVLYSCRGAGKILNLLEREGLEWPVDIWLYKKAKFEKKLIGYSPKHVCPRMVWVDGEPPTTIHRDDRIAVHRPEGKE